MEDSAGILSALTWLLPRNLPGWDLTELSSARHWRYHSGRLAACGEYHHRNVEGVCPAPHPSRQGTELPITKLGVPCPLAFTWTPAVTDVGPTFQPGPGIGFTGCGWLGAAMVLTCCVFSITKASTFVTHSVSKSFLLRSLPIVSLPWH